MLDQSSPPKRFGPDAITHPPCLPDALRRKYAAYISGDTRFAATSRLLAALWRNDRGLPPGVHISPIAPNRTRKPRRIKAGWRLTRADAQAGATFLRPDLLRLFRRELIFRELGALHDTPKILGNLLSSQGASFNIFGPQALDLALATRVWSKLLPAFVHRVTGVAFETSPGRDAANYLEDGTAFDVRLDVVTPDGELAFIAFEVKFAEALTCQPSAKRPRYVEAAHASNLYQDADAPILYQSGVEQLRREHNLAQLAVDNHLYGRGLFILAGPSLNHHVASIARAYSATLREPAGIESDRVGFLHLTIEKILDALYDAGEPQLANAIYERYLDLNAVANLALSDM